MSESEVREISERELPWFYGLSSDSRSGVSGKRWWTFLGHHRTSLPDYGVFLQPTSILPVPANVALFPATPSATLVLFVEITLKGS
jgi:hypothetical protein